MDLLLLILIVLAVLSIGGWGYGYYGSRPVVAGDAVAAPATWVTPIGLLGLLFIIAICVMLFTGWRPFVIAT
jgi:hypothetical protein